MESLDDSKQGSGEDAVNKYEEELYNISVGLQSKRTRDRNNFLTGISITLTISTNVISQYIGASTLSSKLKYIKADMNEVTPHYYKAEYIIIHASNIQSQKHYLAASPNIFFEVTAVVLRISQDQDNYEPFKI